MAIRKKKVNGMVTRNGRPRYVAYSLSMLAEALEKSSRNREKGKIRNIIASKTRKIKFKTSAVAA
jgi:hypothetical protein